MESNGTLLWIRFYFVVVQMLSRVQLFVTPWTEACQASLSFTIFQSLVKLVSIESAVPSNHLVLCRPLLLPSILPSIRVYYQVTNLCPLLMTVLCLVAQSCLILCDPMDCDQPGSSYMGILQTRILEWVSMPSSRRSSQPRGQTSVFSL